MDFNSELLRTELVTYLEEAKKKDPSYSLRALSRKIDIPASNLSAFISNKRSFSGKSVEKIIHKLAPSQKIKDELYEKILGRALPKLTKRTHSFTPNINLIPEALKKIQKFEEDLLNFLGQKDGDEIWSLEIHLKPKK